MNQAGVQDSTSVLTVLTFSPQVTVIFSTLITHKLNCCRELVPHLGFKLTNHKTLHLPYKATQTGLEDLYALFIYFNPCQSVLLIKLFLKYLTSDIK